MSLRTNALLFAAVIAASVTAITAASPPPEDRATADARPVPAFRSVDNWFKSALLKLDELRGKVVLVDFWTYTCSNCLNHLPYVKQWPKPTRTRAWSWWACTRRSSRSRSQRKTFRTRQSGCRSGMRSPRTTGMPPGSPSGTGAGRRSV